MSVFDVFISYRREDGGTELAQKLYDYLDGKGLRVFFDMEEMIGGQHFDDQIRQKIIDAPNYIFIGTPAAFRFRTGKTDWVAEEIKLAISQYDKAPTERVVLPILTAGTIFPDKSAFPKGTEQLPRFDAVLLSGAEPTEAEYQKILKSVTAVNKRNLWNAGHRWLENSKKPGGRFASLDIDATIMPKADRRDNNNGFREMPIRVFRKEKDDEGHESQTEEQPLLNALKETKGHLYLIGQGGIGKTTALISVMNDVYDNKTYSKDRPVPLFVELSRAPDTYGKLYEGGKSTFIRREIYRQIRDDKTVKQVPRSGVGELDKVFGELPYETAVRPVDELLTAETPAPEYLLLLDGLNETSRVEIEDANDRAVVSMIIFEIQWIIDNCPNVRVVLTSRTEDTAVSSEKMTRLYLNGVDDDTIRGYLENRELSAERIKTAFDDRQLLETIRVPLFLTMYASLKNADEVSTQGEIFRTFFSERSENIVTYTAQGRAAEAEAGISSHASRRRITADMQSFILDFILPETAWTMERESAFYFDIDRIAEIIEPVLTSDSIDSVCGKYGKKVFDKYVEGTKKHTRSLAKKMLEKLGDDIDEVTENIIDCAVYSLGIMQEDNDGYGFIHHHIRDYFAAVRNVNSLRLAVYAYEHGMPDDARACLTEFSEKPIEHEVSRFIGEYLHEQRNVPVFVGNEWKYNVPVQPEDRNLMRRSLDLFRSVYDDSVGYGLFNMFHIFRYSNRDLSFLDLSYLDLRRCSLSEMVLGHGKEIGAKLNGSALNEIALGLIYQYGKINSISISPDGGSIALASEAGITFIRNCYNAELINILSDDEKRSNTNVTYSKDGKFLYVELDHKALSIWDQESFTLRHTIYTGEYSSLSPDLKYIATEKEIYDLSTGNIISKLEQPPCYQGQYHLMSVNVNNIWWSSDQKYICASHEDFEETDYYGNPMTDWTQGYVRWEAKSGKIVSCTYDGREVINNPDASDNQEIELRESYPVVTDHSVHNRPFENNSNNVDSTFINDELNVILANGISIQQTVLFPDGKKIAVLSTESIIYIVDIQGKNVVQIIQNTENCIISADIDESGEHLVVVCGDGTIKAFSMSTGELISCICKDNGKLIFSSNTIINETPQKSINECSHDSSLYRNAVDNMPREKDEWVKGYGFYMHKFEYSDFHVSSNGKIIVSTKKSTHKEFPNSPADSYIGHVIWTPYIMEYCNLDFTFSFSSDGNTIYYINSISERDADNSAFVKLNSIKVHVDRIERSEIQLKGCIYEYAHQHFKIDPSANCVIVSYDDGRIIIYNLSSGKIKQKINVVPGLYVAGADLRGLSKQSNISAYANDLLRQYGAII